MDMRLSEGLPDGPRGRVLAVGLTLAVLGALWFGAAAPLLGWYQDRAVDLTQRRQLLARMQAVAETLPALEHQAGGQRPNKPLILPKSKDPSSSV